MSDDTAPVAPEAAPVPVASNASQAAEAAPPTTGASENPPAEGEQPKAEGDESRQDKPKQRASERIGELYGRMKSAERERDAALAEVQRLRQPVVDPNHWDQLTYDQQQAMQVRQAVREERAAEVEQAAYYREREAQSQRAMMLQQRIETFAEREPEILTVLQDPTLPVSEIGARFVAESEKGAEVAFYLHKNRAEAARISRLDPVTQAFELGRIEARISAAPAARKVSQAPGPIPRVGGGANAGAKDPSSMSDDEYSAWYKARKAQRR